MKGIIPSSLQYQLYSTLFEDKRKIFGLRTTTWELFAQAIHDARLWSLIEIFISGWFGFDSFQTLSACCDISGRVVASDTEDERF